MKVLTTLTRLTILISEIAATVSGSNEWSDWVNVSECSTKCGVGTIAQERSRRNESEPGLPEVETRDEICYGEKYCARWSEWENAPTPCSASCGSGKQSQVRNCNDGNVGEPGCQGAVQQFAPCNTQPCPFWSEWSVDFNGGGDCGQFCKQRKRRNCTHTELYPELGPAELCSGPAELEIGCPPCGSWMEWQLDSPCDVSCGSGKSVYFRECLTKDEQFSDDCPGKSTKIETCDLEECPAEFNEETEDSDDSVEGTNPAEDDTDIDSKVLDGDAVLNAFDELIRKVNVTHEVGSDENATDGVDEEDVDNEFNSMLLDLSEMFNSSSIIETATEVLEATAEVHLTKEEIDGILSDVQNATGVVIDPTTKSAIAQTISNTISQAKVTDVQSPVKQITVSKVQTTTPTTTTKAEGVTVIAQKDAQDPIQKISDNPTEIEMGENSHDMHGGHDHDNYEDHGHGHDHDHYPAPEPEPEYKPDESMITSTTTSNLVDVTQPSESTSSLTVSKPSSSTTCALNIFLLSILHLLL